MDNLSFTEIKNRVISKSKMALENQDINGQYKTVYTGNEKYDFLYYPAQSENAPVYIDIHGGGFAWGLMEDGHALCEEINRCLDIVVFAPSYPLTPENPYPSALNHLCGFIGYLVDNKEKYGINVDKMIIGGRSAGANLAAALVFKAKENEDFQFTGQVLDHPYLSLNQELEESKRYNEDTIMTAELMDMLANHYATEAQRNEVYCSPLGAETSYLRGLPTTVIQIAGCDYLSLDGRTYATKLIEADVSVNFRNVPGASHGFTEKNGTVLQKESINWLVSQIRNLIR